MEHTIDAQNKKVGRIATEVAELLRGKNTPEFERHVAPKVTVTVTNASKMDISERKKEGVHFTSHTMHPGGFKSEKLGAFIERKGHAEVLKKAVRGMLPANKLRAQMLKNLTITE